jgi:hypothetical protein
MVSYILLIELLAVAGTTGDWVVDGSDMLWRMFSIYI